MEKKEIIDLVHDICFKLMDSINAEEVSFHDDLVLQINKKICEEIDKRLGEEEPWSGYMKKKLTQVFIRDYKEEGDCDNCKHCGDSIEICILRKCHRAIDEFNDAYECAYTKDDMTKVKAMRELIDFKDGGLKPSPETLDMAINALMSPSDEV